MELELDSRVGGSDGLASKVLTVVLAVVALRSLRRGKRLRALVAGVTAVALGFTATAGRPEFGEPFDVDLETAVEEELRGPASTEAAGEAGDLRCSICGNPIVPGQARGPDANDEIAHVACIEQRQER